MASFGGFAVGSEPKLGLLTWEQSRLPADAGLWGRKMPCLLQAQARGPDGRAQRPDGDFQPEGGGCGARDQLVAVLLIGWWWGHQESA